MKSEIDEGLRHFLVAASRGGGKNFRPVAGHPTHDGRRVAPGRIYRSGAIGELPQEDRARMPELDVRTIVTLQTTQELDLLGHPLSHLAGGIDWEHIPIGDRWFQQGGALSDGLPSMGEFYVKMVNDHAPDWARFLRLFARPERFALVYHCTAGRDRTGVATALLLEMLGVPREVIVEDYLISNRAFEEHAQEAEVLSPLFAAIDASGGIEGFLARLGLEREAMQSARAHLLVEA